jgi:hypothetical protein
LTELLRLQDAALKLCLDPLKLLLGSIASDCGELSSPNGFLCALGFGDCGMKFVENMPLFIGLLVPSRRGHRDLAFLSTNQIQTRLRSKDIAKGVILGFDYDMEIMLLVELAGAKAKALSRVGSGNRLGRVRVGLGGFGNRVSWVKPGRVKPLTRIGLSLIP